MILTPSPLLVVALPALPRELRAISLPPVGDVLAVAAGQPVREGG